MKTTTKRIVASLILTASLFTATNANASTQSSDARYATLYAWCATNDNADNYDASWSLFARTFDTDPIRNVNSCQWAMFEAVYVQNR